MQEKTKNHNKQGVRQAIYKTRNAADTSWASFLSRLKDGDTENFAFLMKEKQNVMKLIRRSTIYQLSIACSQQALPFSPS